MQERSRSAAWRSVLESDAMQVFLSYSAADRRFAERLRDELTRHGVSVWSDAKLAPGSEWKKEIETAIRSSDDILILVSPRNADAAQRSIWRAALEAAWQDPRKRLIPILLRGASVPPFVYSDAAGKEGPLVQILDPHDPGGAADAILQALQGTAAAGKAKTDAAEVATKGSQSFEVEALRSRRLREIEQFAERLKE
jgi:TIR domain